MHSLYQTTNHLALLVLEEKMVKVSAIQNQEVPIVAMFFLCEFLQASLLQRYISIGCLALDMIKMWNINDNNLHDPFGQESLKKVLFTFEWVNVI